MRPPYQCLFCGECDSLAFTSVEHPIPESLGNDDEVLQPGFVCNACNQYFGAKIEARVLAAPPFNIERTAHAIRTKKGKVPIYAERDLIFTSIGSVDRLLCLPTADAPLRNPPWKRWIIPKEPKAYDELLVRFLLKVGLELLILTPHIDSYSKAYRLARRCARYGERANEWDLAWGIYPSRSSLLISSRVDEVGQLDTHQIYQYEIGVMPSGDAILCFVYAQAIFACNLSRPPITEYLLSFNEKNHFGLQSRWHRRHLALGL